jgi:hypothetical protein
MNGYPFNSLLNYSADFGNVQFRNYVSSSLNIIEQSSHSSSELNGLIAIQELNNYIKTLKRGKSSGIDSVTNEMILDGGAPLHKTILNILNNILLLDVYLVIWQTNIILLVFKSGSLDPNNYRGIALSSCLGKVIHHVINTRIEKYLADKNIISINQNDFQRRHRTEDNIMIMKPLFKAALNARIYIIIDIVQ